MNLIRENLCIRGIHVETVLCKSFGLFSNIMYIHNLIKFIEEKCEIE